MSMPAKKGVSGGRGAGHGRKRAVVVGGGMHAACVLDALKGSGFSVVGCVDDEKPAGHLVYGGARVLGRMDMLADLLKSGVKTAFIGVGGPTDNRPRAGVFQRVLGLGFDCPPVVHPDASLAGEVELGPGSVVLAGVTVGPFCEVGANVILNQGCTVCHNCVIEDDAHIAPGAVLAGKCRVGRAATVGMGATVLTCLSIGEGALVCNGVAVLSDVPAGAVVRAYAGRVG
jgi:sugar O-acyltransferase (sialic acid O-acetyltransferase NeuD family)